jgi:hypothetical protein
MKIKSIQTFIREHRKELTEAIINRLIHHDSPGLKRNFRIDDEERRLWVLNDEGLYNWARSEGVKV